MPKGGSIATCAPSLCKKLGYAWGSFIEIRYPEQDTLIVRKLEKITCREKMLPDAIYVDEDAFKLLCAEILDQIVVRASDYGITFP